MWCCLLAQPALSRALLLPLGHREVPGGVRGGKMPCAQSGWLEGFISHPWAGHQASYNAYTITYQQVECTYRLELTTSQLS